MTALTNGQITLVVLQRMTLGIGVILGFVPLIGIPFVALGGDGTALADSSMVLCGSTLLPASLLAFWWRRAASYWFGVNAAVALLALFFGSLLASGDFQDAFFYVALPVFFLSSS